MADRKELIISAKLELQNQAFNQGVKQAQDMLSKLSSTPQQISMQRDIDQKLRQLGLGGLPGLSGPQAQKDSENKFREEIRVRLQSLRDLVEKEKVLSKELEQQKLNKQNTLTTEKELNKVLEERSRKEGEIAAIVDRTQQKQEGFLSKLKSQMTLRNVATLAAGIGGLAAGAGSIYGSLLQRPIETTQARGAAMQGTVGNQLGNMFGGKAFEEMQFMPQRMEAARMASEALRGAPMRDWLKTVGDVVMQTVVGGVGGMTSGAMIGATFGGIGAIPGAIGGGAFGAGGGLVRSLTNTKNYNLLASGLGSTEGAQFIQAQRSQEFAANLSKAFEGLKEEDPFRKLAIQQFDQNRVRDLQMQRLLGLGNVGYRGAGGFLQSAMGAGFVPEMGIQTAQDIISAGGSTRMGRGATSALQMQRGLDLTNAPQVMGMLSGGLGSAESTKNATIKILSEGVKLGLNDSEFVEENRKFTQATAEILTRTGARSPEDIQKTIETFGRFLSERTVQGVTAAQSAYERYQEMTSEKTGPRAAMATARIMKDPVLGKLPRALQQALLNLPENQISEMEPIIQAAAIKSPGTKIGDIVNTMKEIKQSSTHLFGTERDELDSIRKLGIDMNSPDALEELRKKAPDLFAAYVPHRAITGRGNLGTLGFRSLLTKDIKGEVGGGTEDLRREAMLANQAAAIPAGRPEDLAAKMDAAAASESLRNLNMNLDQMVKVTEEGIKSIGPYIEGLRHLNEEMAKARKEGRTDEASKMQNLLDKAMGIFGTNTSAPNQTQGSRESK